MWYSYLHLDGDLLHDPGIRDGNIRIQDKYPGSADKNNPCGTRTSIWTGTSSSISTFSIMAALLTLKTPLGLIRTFSLIF